VGKVWESQWKATRTGMNQLVPYLKQYAHGRITRLR